ncbi:MAG: MmgE/PrpD family protein [Geminicoccaceae bacterium]|nr:MAG: MmgE/PrpD family protein [Geminicoccaceae bacterium]
MPAPPTFPTNSWPIRPSAPGSRPTSPSAVSPPPRKPAPPSPSSPPPPQTFSQARPCPIAAAGLEQTTTTREGPVTHIETICEHVASTDYTDLPEAAIAAAKTFVLDTLGVGLAGSSGPKAQELVTLQAGWGQGTDARVWASTQRLPAPAAAFCNAYQAHNAEFDCIHEQAVAHVMTVVLPVALAGAERLGGVDGKRLLTAVVLGVDVAASLGVAARSGLRFFRPATVGAFGGAAALGKLLGFDKERLHHALSIAYGQLCGTMQAHTEGSLLLAMQVAFNARNAVVAADLAAAGIEGPLDVLEGRFGYFTLFEDGGDLAPVIAQLGRVWRITEVAHKPFPTGRATHGIIDGCLTLQRRHGFKAEQIGDVRAVVPPLVHHLVGRPPLPAMAINYARLCAPFVAARALLTGTVGLEDFTDAVYRDPATQNLASRITVEVEDRGDPNALTPVSLSITLVDGRTHELRLTEVYGHPAKPMPREAQLAKLHQNAALAANPIPNAKLARLIDLVDDLENVDDVGHLVDQLVP